MSWQSMNTAPDDGTHILLLIGEDVVEAWHEAADWLDESTHWRGNLSDGFECGVENAFGPPDYWMPKPALPSATTTSQVLDAATIERCAQVAESLTRKVPYDYNPHPCYSTMRQAAAAIRNLATDPHQHGAGNGGDV